MSATSPVASRWGSARFPRDIWTNQGTELARPRVETTLLIYMLDPNGQLVDFKSALLIR